MNSKARILFIIPGFSLGGTTTALTSLLNSEISDCYDIDVFAISKRGFILPPISLHNIGRNSLTTAYYSDYSSFSFKEKFSFFFIKLLKQNPKYSAELEKRIIRSTIKKIERKKQYDVVVGFQEGLATRFASQFTCPRKIAWIHCDYANAYGEEVNELDLYSGFEKVVCVSQFTLQGFVGRYPALANKTIAIHNIFDAKSVIERAKTTIDDTRFDTSCFTIISLGRIHDVKRFYLIPEIAAQLKKAGLDFRWYILGSADIPSELQRLTDAIQRNGMKEYVIYLGGKPNPYPYLKAADLMVTLSKSEACPMIFNEAKILHVQVLSSDFGSVFEFVEQGKDGYISSLDKFPQKLLDLANHHDKLASIRNNQVHFDSNDTILKQLKNLIAL